MRPVVPRHTGRLKIQAEGLDMGIVATGRPTCLASRRHQSICKRKFSASVSGDRLRKPADAARDLLKTGSVWRPSTRWVCWCGGAS